MAITNITTDWGTYPRIVRIVTTDTIGTITTAGYLTAQASAIQALQNGAFQWTPNDFVAISYSGGKGFFNVDYTVNNTFLPIAGVQNMSLKITAAQIATLYTTPLQLIPAAGAHTWIVLMSPIAVEYDFGTAQYTGGGAFGLEYGNTAHLAGTAASSTEAAATINAFAASNGFTLTAAATGTMANMVNEGIYISNTAGVFATGDGTMTVNAQFAIYNTTA
jgi:hypothetical protein